MYLSRLRIYGFKSFATKVEVVFPADGITAVVGPNGCGKSNIIDAIRWVLGEQRAKALRSSKMEDVIFSGTAEKPPLNLSEVSLLVNNDSGRLPSEYSQIMITRRVFRNGDSEYQLNNQPCRLKDIQNLFFDTGMGAASYSLIEAKMIDSILSDKPEERRVLFEEAAGISKYKQQRKETLRQLEKTATDLARVEDNLRHIQQNVSMFERQAKKAEKWKELNDKYVSLELSYQYDSYKEFQKQFNTLRKEIESWGGESNSWKARISTEETRLEEKKVNQLKEEEQLGKLNQTVVGTQSELMRLNNECERIRDRINHLEESLEKMSNEGQLAAQKLAGFSVQIEQTQQEIKNLEQQGLHQRTQVDNHRRALDEFLQKLREVKEEADSLGESRMAIIEQASSSKSQLESVRVEKRHLEDILTEAESQLESSKSREEELQTRQKETEEKLLELNSREENEKEKRITLQNNLEKLQDEIKSKQESTKQLETKKLALEARCQVLEDLRRSREGLGGGAQFLLKQHPELCNGLLADRLDPGQDWIETAEKSLGVALETVMLSDSVKAGEALRLLRESEKGSASLFFESSGNNIAKDRPPYEQIPGAKGWVIDHLNVSDSLKGLMEYLIGNYLRVSTFDEAIHALDSLKNGDFHIITDSGEIIHTSGLVRDESKEQTGLLGQKAELEKLTSELEEINRELENEWEGFRQLESQREEARQMVDSATNEIAECGMIRRELENNKKILVRSLEELTETTGNAQARLHQVRERMQQLHEKETEAGQKFDEAEKRKNELEERYQISLNEVRKAEDHRQQLEEKAKESEREYAGLENQLRNLRTKLDYLEQAKKEQLTRQDQASQQGEEWAHGKESGKARLEELADQIQSVHEKLEIQEKQRDQAKAAYDEKMGEQEEIRLKIRDATEKLQEATREVHNREMKLEQIKSHMGNLRERMFEIHEVDLDSEEPGFEQVEYDASSVESEIKEAKEKLKRLGSVHTGALEDYETEKQKMEEVQKQFEDLEKARIGLERAIRKLDRVAREQFQETFELVKNNFQKVFSTLFEGGEAHVSLEENIDPLDAKIEINARPTGKKMRGVTLLSGGERALTAISLLFALYLVKPSPYCIMDEVDGPLDDANIDRFVKLLRGFSHQTQFIVVTHNKRTMAAADKLYGVTQEVKGISRLVSVQLNEAARIAA